MVTACPVCATTGLPWLDLGPQPLANALRRRGELPMRYPLGVLRCPSCALSWLQEPVDPAILFTREYPFEAGVSEDWVEHAYQLARWLRRRIPGHGQVLDVGSNDATLVASLCDVGITGLGVDVTPQSDIHGFMPEATRVLEDGSLDAITATNVLAHCADPHAVIAECRRLLTADGLLVIEVPWVKDLLATGAFDTIYHEHRTYWSLMALRRLLEAHDFGLVEWQRFSLHGGTLRVVAMPNRAPTVDWDETEVALLVSEPYDQAKAAWIGRLENLRHRLETPARTAAFGASAKGTGLASALFLGPLQIAYVVDETPAKQGWITPYGVPIVPLDMLRTDPVDRVLVFAWNWLEAIERKLKPFGVEIVSAA